MPHFTIDYSGNLDGELDVQAMVECVRKAALATGVFPIGGVRVRAHRCDYWSIADGSPDNRFVDMVLRMGEGRDLETRKRAGEQVFAALSDFLDPLFARHRLALQFEIREIANATSWKRNNLHEALNAKR